MDKFIVKTSKPLKGSVKISGAKNSALPIIAATILSVGKCTLKNIPYLSDVETLIQILNDLGAKIVHRVVDDTIEIDTTVIENITLPYNLVKKIRASFLLAGPILARFGSVSIQLPGGCQIGVRPVDLHLKGFSVLGAEVSQEHGIINISTKGLQGGEIYLDFPSVGATENIMMAAVLAKGETIISNAAVEPEVVDLANFLNKLGANIVGAGSDMIKITGVKELNGAEYSIIPDRIEAGTFMLAGVITKGELYVENVVTEHLKPVVAKLREMNVDIDEGENSIRIAVLKKLKNTDIKTLPFPGFPTDMQAQFMSTMALVEGTSIINETIFENRFMHVGELNRMGADIKIESNVAVIKGVEKFTGTQVRATDLRAGASLILSALAAEGITEIGEIHHIERGYYKIDEKLRRLGADITKINV